MSRLLMAGALLCFGASACGGGSPTGPTYGSSSWGGTYSITDVSGGECVGQATRERVGGPPTFYLLGITVQGGTLNVLVVDTYNGSTAHYTGAVGSSHVSFKSRDPQPVAAPVSTFYCSDTPRDVQFSSGSISADITGDVMSGTTTEIYSVRIGGTQTSVGNMTITAVFTATKQRE